MSSRFHCGWCLNLISVPAIGLGHYDPLSSHEIDGVRKEKERLTAVSLFSIFPSVSSIILAHFSEFICVLIIGIFLWESGDYIIASVKFFK